MEIVDIYHAREYLWAAAHALFGEASPEAAIPVPSAVTAAIRYFQNQHGRMDYPRYRALGLAIGSGIVDGACKSVLKQRLTAAGMRWTASGAQAFATLRARHRSGRWQEFWDTQPYTKRASEVLAFVA